MLLPQEVRVRLRWAWQDSQGQGMVGMAWLEGDQAKRRTALPPGPHTM